MDNEVIDFIGLGLMGTTLIKRLLERGYRVAGWNRSRAKANALIARGAEWCDNSLAACGRVIVSLYTTDVIVQVLEEMQDALLAGQQNWA